MEKSFQVEGMHCKSCKALIEMALGEIEGVSDASADFVKGTVKAKFADENSLKAARVAIEKEGYRVV
ncbi:MAG TPA: heavy-metal-associated domain-containing protein [Candidatus Diapherotrites archaeon]|uniref:Heavy-metal-associated domain-containing protein n=1 Tax=Candidatus Iainarchaeum sp. TaxID=3101447 RepID=A0A7J4J0P7_9ARCH|nr:heavy-metal-associated domain-containing protein [Candidatus Diapherotrites archaeon]